MSRFTSIRKSALASLEADGGRFPVGQAPALTLLGRGYCHLCHEMQQQLVAMSTKWRFNLTVIDVDSDPALEARYGDFVPVLLHGELELSRYRLDAQVVEEYLRRAQNDSLRQLS